jgi:hypothetical protein
VDQQLHDLDQVKQVQMKHTSIIMVP